MAQPDFDSIRQAPECPAPDYDSLVKSAVYAVRYRAPEEPTEAQIKAGNYPKRKVPWQGMTISVENEAGTTSDGNTMIFWTKRTKPLQGYSRTHHLPEMNRCDRLQGLRR